MKLSKNVIVLAGAILALVFAGSSAFINPVASLVWQISGGIGIALLILYLVLDFKRYRSAMGKKSTRFGLYSVFASILFLAILTFINLIAVEHDWKKDFTQNQIHTLSDQTLKVIRNLEQEITFKVFIYPERQSMYDKIFDKYTYETDKIKVVTIDIDKDPVAAQQNNVTQAGVIIVESEARSARIENMRNPDDPKAEERLTNAIIQVAKGDKRKIYFVQGHGEKQLANSEEGGLSTMKTTLEEGRYEVAELTLMKESSIPPDATVVIIPGPITDFFDHEIKALDTYVRSGGKLLVMMEPNSSIKMKAFLQGFGVKWDPNATVFERNPLQQQVGGNPLMPVVTSYDKSHQITQGMSDPTVFPLSTPIEKLSKLPEGVQVSTLFSSSPLSLGATLQGGKLAPNPNVKGPISMAVAVTGPSTQSDTQEKKEEKKGMDAIEEAANDEAPAKTNEYRLAVIGDSDFITNKFRGIGMNSDVFQNSLSWLAHEEDLIAVRPKATDTSKFDITEARFRIIFLGSVIFAPLMLWLAALGVWWRRRRA